MPLEELHCDRLAKGFVGVWWNAFLLEDARWERGVVVVVGVLFGRGEGATRVAEGSAAPALRGGWECDGFEVVCFAGRAAGDP